MITLQEVIEMAKTFKEGYETQVVVYSGLSTILKGEPKIAFGFFLENGLNVGYKGSFPNGDEFEVLAIV